MKKAYWTMLVMVLCLMISTVVFWRLNKKYSGVEVSSVKWKVSGKQCKVDFVFHNMTSNLINVQARASIYGPVLSGGEGPLRTMLAEHFLERELQPYEQVPVSMDAEVTLAVPWAGTNDARVDLVEVTAKILTKNRPVHE